MSTELCKRCEVKDPQTKQIADFHIINKKEGYDLGLCNGCYCYINIIAATPYYYHSQLLAMFKKLSEL